MELDLGCGKEKHVGAIGLDMNPGINPDVLFEFRDRNLLPFQENTFDKIWMFDFLEHVDDPQWLLSEVHRVAQSNAQVEIRYPHYSYRSAHSDLTHRHRGFGIRIFEHYDPTTKYGKKYKSYKQFGRDFPFKIENVTPNYCLGRCMIPWMISKVVGANVYEAYISNILPIVEVNSTLRVVKDKK
jgi:SAM-dependent methyltransferase